MNVSIQSSLQTMISFFLFRYVPTRLWGFSGHVQTVLHSIVGRLNCPWPLGERVYLSLKDGSTLTYDLYQPLNEHEGKFIPQTKNYGYGYGISLM